MARWTPPRFNLYGATPSAAAAQQAPWTDFYTRHNVEEAARAEQNFEQARNLQAVMDQREREAQDRADRLWYADREARRQEAINFAIYGQDLAQKRADQAEEMRRFNLGLTDLAAKRAEERRQFDEQTKVAREGLDIKRQEFEPLPTAAEMSSETENILNAYVAQQKATQRNNAERMAGRVLTPDEAAKAEMIRPETAEQIRRLAQARVGTIPSEFRFDEPTGWFTRQAPASAPAWTPNPTLTGNTPSGTYNWNTGQLERAKSAGLPGGTGPAPLSVTPSPFPAFNAPAPTATAAARDWNPDDFERRPASGWNPDEFERR